jgi:hypothetical protein
MELRSSHYYISSNTNHNINNKYAFQNRTNSLNINEYKKDDSYKSIINEIFISSFIYVTIRGTYILYTLLQW